MSISNFGKKKTGVMNPKIKIYGPQRPLKCFHVSLVHR